MIKLPCSLFLQTLTPVTLSLHCPFSSSNAAAAAAFPGSDIRALIGPFMIGYLYWLLKYCQRFEYQFKLGILSSELGFKCNDFA